MSALGRHSVLVVQTVQCSECCCDVCDCVALDPFPTVIDPQIHRPVVGSALSLHCDPPPSYPPGTVYWGETNNGPKLRPIENTDRVSLDYEGNHLYTCCAYTRLSSGLVV